MFWNLIFREFRGVSHFSTAFLPSLHRHGFQPPFTLVALPRNFGQDIAMVAYVLLVGWSLALQVVTIAEAHQISKWKAFWAGTAQLLTIFVVLLILGTLFAVFWYFGRN
jgi:hypothetical protein